MTLQTTLKLPEPQRECLKEEELRLKIKILEDIVSVIFKQIDSKSSKKIIKIFEGNFQNLNSEETGNQKPEEFTKKNIIDPLLEKFLEYDIRTIKKEPMVKSERKRRDKYRFPDYKIELREGILIEAEHLGRNLEEKNIGIDQVYDWLDSISTNENIGIATNGLIWYLFYRDKKSNKINLLKEVDLRSVFSIIYRRKDNKLLTENISDNINKTINEFYCSFSRRFIYDYVETATTLIENKKEEITSNFYKEFLELIFGYAQVNNEIREIESGNYLLAKIKPPKTEVKEDPDTLKKFAIVFTNRLFTLKFMEDKGLIPKSFLLDLWKKYRDSAPTISFYKSYLSQIFYGVLNKPKGERNNELQNEFYDNIPYLNGGLFRENMENEHDYDVDNSIMKDIINFLESYTFTVNRNRTKNLDEKSLNPDILGNIYEKTVNLLTNGQQKKTGSYYTPQIVTNFIIENTVDIVVFRKLKEFFRKNGWKDNELENYRSLKDMFNKENPITKDRKTLMKVMEVLDSISILDPACGSGHFLIEALEKLTRIKKMVYYIAGDNKTDFQIKKGVVINNLYGVDIDPISVEITKLRLWLSLIEDLEIDNSADIEVLPNIEYNILHGDSLTGYKNMDEIRNYIEGYFEVISDNLKEVEELKKKYANSTDYNDSEKLRESIKEKYKIINEKLNGTTNSEYIIPVGRVGDIRLNWPIAFYDVLSRFGGFDLIIGNPPYGDLLSEKQKLFVRGYSDSVNEIAAVFVDRFVDLISEGGILSYIITFAITFNKGLSSVRKKLRDNFETIKVYSFDRDKCRIFSTMTQSVSIMIADNRRNNANGKFLTSRFLRTLPEDFNSISLEEANNMLLLESGIGSDFSKSHRLPKLGERRVVDIISKLLRCNRMVENLLNINEKKTIIYYRTSGNYWYNAWNWKPYESSEIKALEVPESYADFIIMLVNSSLFYFYLRIYGDGRHMNTDIFRSFPVPAEDKVSSRKKEIHDVVVELMRELQSNFDAKHKRFITSKVKPVIDKCDKLLSEIYELSPEDLEYIINYDSEIRSNEDV